MPVLHIGDVEIVAHAQQLTSPALHIKNAAGEIYHVAVMPLGGGVFDATETLVYEEDTINTCQTVTLPAGIYRVEMRGGTGGKPYSCQSGVGKVNFTGEIITTVFKLNTETVVYSFRGGDGNDGGYASSYATVGGGASGVDSMLIVGDRTIRANGGVGTKCSLKFCPNGDGGGFNSLVSGGGGGVYSDDYINDGGGTKYENGYIMAPSGGGANASGGGKGGAGETVTPADFMAAITGDAADGNDFGGGDGGDIENLLGTSATKNTATGGAGGANVYYSCGGQVAVSYGGGGGGALCVFNLTSTCADINMWCITECRNGGDGGSGSTGTSNDSYIKIYKIG